MVCLRLRIVLSKMKYKKIIYIQLESNGIHYFARRSVLTDNDVPISKSIRISLPNSINFVILFTNKSEFLKFILYILNITLAMVKQMSVEAIVKN